MGNKIGGLYQTMHRLRLGHGAFRSVQTPATSNFKTNRRQASSSSLSAAPSTFSVVAIGNKKCNFDLRSSSCAFAKFTFKTGLSADAKFFIAVSRFLSNWPTHDNMTSTPAFSRPWSRPRLRPSELVCWRFPAQLLQLSGQPLSEPILSGPIDDDCRFQLHNVVREVHLLLPNMEEIVETLVSSRSAPLPTFFMWSAKRLV